MEKKTILVTGGAGYIGSFTVRELLGSGYKVVVLDSLENGHREAVDPRASLEVVNLSDQNKVEQIFDRYDISAVIDFAAYLEVGGSMENPKKYMENNVVNFVKLLDVMKKKGCKYIIKSSTASVYGSPLSPDDFPLKEDYHEGYKPSESALLPGKWDGKDAKGEEFFQAFVGCYKEIFSDRPDLELTGEELSKLRIPTSIYGLTKLLDEIVLNKYNDSSDMKSVALRYFNVCGASLDGKNGDDKPRPTNLMTMVILNLLGKNDKLKIYGNDYPTEDGTGIRDYIHVLDLARGHVSALGHLIEEKKSGTFNLGNGTGYSVLEVVAAVEKASGEKVKYDILPRRSGDMATSIADASKAREILGFKAKYRLDDMAETAWKWHSNNPEGY